MPDESDLQGVISHLESIARRLELIDRIDFYEIQAYEDAASALQESPPGVLEDPEQVHGIGESISATIEDYLTRGTSEKWEWVSQETPDVDELIRVEGIGPKMAIKIHEEYGISTLDELEEAAHSEKLQKLDGIGEITESNILEEIDEVRSGAQDRMDYEYVESYYNTIQRKLVNLGVDRFEPAGSFRRGEDDVGDLDIIVQGDDANVIFEALEQLSEKTISRGKTKMTFRIDDVQVDVRVVPRDEYGACLQYFTGDLNHNISLRKYAISQGYTINEYGIYEIDGYEDGSPKAGKKVGGESEEDIYNVLGLPVPSPENRTQSWVQEQT